ncbi:MAG TPA: cyclopropane-fatty-acyl-phospholipid synthase family protein [Terriglobales bacterium]|nr:cyclopropane-fatty-acyl-phospholipid synthase family protein [Terriglobales bacterium]
MGNQTSWLDRLLLRAIHRAAGPVPVRMSSSGDGAGDSVLSTIPVLRVADRRTLLSLALNPEMGFGDGYTAGRIEVEGDLLRLLEIVSKRPRPVATRYSRLLSGWLAWIQANTLRGSRSNIHHHYDLSGDFYQLWLDPQMVYTCAYFPEPTATLEAAQSAKLDHVSRKLWLQPGETVVEAGCGWGSLALHMARNYGVRVKAFNISHEQIAFARERARREGLSGRVEFIEDDYRNVRGQFDVFASVGMLEHVGREHYRQLGDIIHRAIGDRGRGLLHFIGRNYHRPLNTWLRKRIFPGAYVPTLREVMDVVEPHDMSVLDVENLRFHYARTLEHWLTAFERSFDTVVQRHGSDFARMWRLYLAGSIAAFRAGALQLFQLVFAGRDCQSIPWTRAYLYEAPGEDNQGEATWIRAIS